MSLSEVLGVGCLLFAIVLAIWIGPREWRAYQISREMRETETVIRERRQITEQLSPKQSRGIALHHLWLKRPITERQTLDHIVDPTRRTH
jgi:hypothetical protein